jgi:LPXTG-motif cell wall-anchored protein
MDLTPAAARTTRLRRPVTALCLTAALLAAPLAWAPAAHAAVDPVTGTTQTEPADVTLDPTSTAPDPTAAPVPVIPTPGEAEPAVEEPAAEALSPTPEAVAVPDAVAVPEAVASPEAVAPVREEPSISIPDDMLDPDQPVSPGIDITATGFLPGETVDVTMTSPSSAEYEGFGLITPTGESLSEDATPADDRGRIAVRVFLFEYYAANGAYTITLTGAESGLVLTTGYTVSGESAVADDSDMSVPEAPAISIPRTTISPDDLVRPGVPVTATGFLHGERVTASLRAPSDIGDGFALRRVGEYTSIGTTQTADERGRWAYTAVLEGAYYAPDGDYVLTLTGERSGLVLTQGFTVAGVSDTSSDGDHHSGVAAAARLRASGRDTLPVTGGGDSALALGGLGALMLLAGGALVARRRHRSA